MKRKVVLLLTLLVLLAGLIPVTALAQPANGPVLANPPNDDYCWPPDGSPCHAAG